MRKEERRKYILRKAQSDGFVSIPNSAEYLGVSVETVRRDITALEKEGILKKTHGGATPIKTPIRKDADYTRRLSLNQQEKNAIGSEAASMIRSGMVVALDCGVSIQAAARSISGVENVTLVTNSLPIADILTVKAASGELKGRIIFIGGEMDIMNRFAVGAAPIRELEKYHFDLAIVSCTAFSTDGASAYTLDEAAYSSALIKNSSASVLIAESVKAGKNSVCTFAGLNDFKRIITDDSHKLSGELERFITNTQTELIVVNCPAF